MNKGKVTLVGAGPYDKGLITVKGLKAIKSAECILYDRLVNPSFLQDAPMSCEKIDVGKKRGAHKVVQSEINNILLQKAQEGKNVVRLKGGDPFLFGRGAEELTLLRENNIPFEVVPGVTSVIAAPAYAGIPVTHRDYSKSLHIITGHPHKGELTGIDFDSLASMGGTIVFVMGSTSIGKICGGLIKAGMDKACPAAIVENGTSSRQRVFVGTVTNLCKLAEDNNVISPSLVIIGSVAALSEEFAWTGGRPLEKTKVIAACHQGSAEKLYNLLEEKGCDVIAYPTARVKPVIFNPDAADGFSCIAFTSKQGAKYFIEGIISAGKDIRSLHGVKIAAIGAETEKELKKYGIVADFVPEVFDGVSLAKCLRENVKGNIIIPGASTPSEHTKRAIEQLGVSVTYLPVYETELIKNIPIDPTDADYILFTSASTIEGLALSLGGEKLAGLKAICIGNQTAEAARHYAMKTYISNKSTFYHMVELLEELQKPDTSGEIENGL